MSAEYDVVLVTDCTVGGATVTSLVEEAWAQHEVGLHTGLVHSSGPAGKSEKEGPPAFDPRLVRLIDEGLLTLALEPEIRAGLAILRVSTLLPVLEQAATHLELPRLRVGHALVVVDQMLEDGAETAASSGIADLTTALEGRVDGEIRYAPVGPRIRQQLQALSPDLPLHESDWVDVVDVDRFAADPERCFSRPRPTLGRHFHPTAAGEEQWPGSDEDILAAYPADPAVAVRLLGDVEPIRRRLGELPRHWNALPTGAQAPEHFLADLDVWVGFPHPDKADLRPILEALASGTPVILPHALEARFGPGPAYETPAEVLRRITGWRDAPEKAQKVGLAGQQLVRDRFSRRAHARRVNELLGGNERTAAGLSSGPTHTGEFRKLRKSRVLFVSSNGAGVGHLMRLMSMARRASDSTIPLFLTLSQAVSAVRKNGFPVEYLMSRGYCDLDYQPWHALLRARLGEIIRAHDVRALVFDGTWLYKGLLQALDDHPQVKAVWSRRGMWRAEINNPTLESSSRFDLILEPGEFAAESDVGPTARRRHEVTRVAPVTFLDKVELLDCRAARQQLGLDPDRPAALVQLGAGAINDITALTETVIDRLTREPDLQVCVTQSIIAERANAAGGHAVSIAGIYPVARYLRAFDFAVAAPGYNSFHELIASGVPALFVPNLDTASDDQAARSRYAAAVNVGLHADPTAPEQVVARLEELLDPARRTALGRSAADQSPDNGAADAMAAIEHLLEDGASDPFSSGSAPAGEAASALVPAPRTSTDGVRPSGRKSPSSKSTKPVKSVVTRASSSPGARAVARQALALLPDPVQTGVRQRLGRVVRRYIGTPRTTPAAVRTPVPPGTLLPPGERSDLAGVAVILGPDLTRERCRATLERIAGLQVAHRNFAPLVVTFDDVLLPQVRALGLAVELMLTPQEWELLDAGDGWSKYVRDRLAHLRSIYRLKHMVVHGQIAGLDDLEMLSLGLPGQQ